MERIIEIIQQYGLETVIVALLVNLATGLVKLPIKAWAQRFEDSTRVTRFIVFLPIVLGFLFSFCYARFIKGGFRFDGAFATLWLTSSSLSLTFYAIFEKLFPKNGRSLDEEEIEASGRIVQGVQELVENFLSEEKTENVAEEPVLSAQSEPVGHKIILRGHSHAKTEIKK